MLLGVTAKHPPSENDISSIDAFVCRLYKDTYTTKSDKLRVVGLMKSSKLEYFSPVSDAL